MKITDKRLAAIKARCEAATAGPWKVGEGLLQNEAGLYVGPTRVVIEGKEREYAIASSGDVRNKDSHADGEFIAAARTDIPDLVAEVESLRRQLTTAQAKAAGFEIVVQGLAKRLEMATAFRVNNGAFTIVAAAGGFEVSRWNPRTRDSEYLSDSGRWRERPDSGDGESEHTAFEEECIFQTADAAFAALLDAARRKQG